MQQDETMGGRWRRGRWTGRRSQSHSWDWCSISLQSCKPMFQRILNSDESLLVSMVNNFPHVRKWLLRHNSAFCIALRSFFSIRYGAQSPECQVQSGGHSETGSGYAGGATSPIQAWSTSGRAAGYRWGENPGFPRRMREDSQRRLKPVYVYQNASPGTSTVLLLKLNF